MGRLTQFFAAVNAEHFPTKLEQGHYYTHINLRDPAIAKLIKRLRREKKQREKTGDNK